MTLRLKRINVGLFGKGQAVYSALRSSIFISRRWDAEVRAYDFDGCDVDACNFDACHFDACNLDIGLT